MNEKTLEAFNVADRFNALCSVSRHTPEDTGYKVHYRGRNHSIETADEIRCQLGNFILHRNLCLIPRAKSARPMSVSEDIFQSHVLMP